MDFELTDDQVVAPGGHARRSSTAASRSTSCATSKPPARLDRERWHELGETGVFSLRAPRGRRRARARHLRGGARVRGARARARARPARRHPPRRAARSTAPPTGEPIVGLFEPAEPVQRDRAPRRSRRAARARRRRRSTASTRRRSPRPRSRRPLDALTPLWRRRRRAPRRRARSPTPRPRDACRLVGMVLTARAPARPRAARHRARDRVRQGARAVRPGRSARSRRSSTSAPTCSCGPRSRAPRCTPPRSRSTAGATTIRPGRRRSAKVMAGDAALANGKTCIQVHGGIGFTWEVDAQRFWKRAVRARHALRQQRRARRGRRRAALTRREETTDGDLRRTGRHRHRRRAVASGARTALAFAAEGRQGRRQRPRCVARRVTRTDESPGAEVVARDPGRRRRGDRQRRRRQRLGRRRSPGRAGDRRRSAASTPSCATRASCATG